MQELLQEILSSHISYRESERSGITAIGSSHFVAMRWERLQLPNIYHEDEVRTAEIRVERYTEAGLSVTLFELLDQALFNFRILSYMSLLYTFPLLYKLL